MMKYVLTFVDIMLMLLKYDEISGCRWGCGAWGGLFPSFLFEFFFVFLPKHAKFCMCGPVGPPPSPGRVKYYILLN